jgi:phage tail-like protein
MKQREIEWLLPGVFQRAVHPGNPLDALLAVMEELHASDEDILDRLDTYFDPYRAPDAFVPYLAYWVDLARFLPADIDEALASSAPLWPPGLGRLRELIAASADLSRWRGTAAGLVRFLETATGVQGFRIDEQPIGTDDLPQPFHITVYAPLASQVYEPLLRRIINQEKPAYVSYELRFNA